MTRVIHTGDTHLGYRQYHVPERRRDFLDAFRRVVEDAVADDVDAVVHAGDLFHDRRPDLGDLLGTIAVLRELRDAGIPFLAVVGNHESTRTVTVDDADGVRRDAQWLDLFETMGLATRLDAGGTVVGDVAFYGLDHVPESRRDDLDYEFEPRDAEATALVSHGQFKPLAPGSWDVEAVLAESNLDFDAVLLGDEHEHATEEVDGAWVTYCGSTERTSASERDPRGYNLVGFEEEVAISRRGIDTRPFVFVDLDLAESEGVARVTERVREESVEDAVVVVTLEGKGGTVTPAEVEEFAAERGALVARVNDRREVEDPADGVEVSFADPDEAVRRRVREMGLSEAARAVDETVRSGGVADANVRDAVEDRVRGLLDDDPAAFEPAPEPEVEADPASDDEHEPAGDDDEGEPTGSGPTDDADGESTDDGGEPAADEPSDDGQVTMEDYL